MPKFYPENPKDTTVSTTTGDLNVKGTTDQRVGTTARSEMFELGTAQESGADRRRRLQTFEITGDMGYAGHTNLDAVQAQVLYSTQQTNTNVKLRWTCGAIGQGRQFVKTILDAYATPYLGNATEGTAGGTLYVYDVNNEFEPFPCGLLLGSDGNGNGNSNANSNSNGNANANANFELGANEYSEVLGNQSSSAQLSGLTLPAVAQFQQIYVDCQDGAAVCTVANTNCCVHTWDEETMLYADDCPGDHTCAGCGCMCIPPGTPESRCYSGCELTEPYEQEASIPGNGAL